MEFKFDDSQNFAIKLATTEKLAIICGGAGRGKSTIIKKIRELLTKMEFKVKLAAPTGKAAARIREATGVSASTIHSLLGLYDSSSKGETFDGKIAVIVDESSMVDSWLMAKLIKAKPEVLILVGDNAQLFPVGAGAPFHDIIDLKKELVAELSTCYRSSEAVSEAGESIRHGEEPRCYKSANEHFEFISTGSPEDTHEHILDYVRNGNIDFDTDIILCPRTGEKNEDMKASVKTLNQDIVKIVNPRENGEKWKINDRVYCKKNFAKSDVWNGTTGIITAIDSEKEMYVRNDLNGEEVRFNAEMIRKLDFGYALTVHKSQGSQYRKVIMVCLSRDSFTLLDRSLLYTGITRTQEHCIVMGDKRAFNNAIQTKKTRTTALQQLAQE